MDIEEKFQLSIQAGEIAYNDSEGNLEYALHEALKHYTRPTPPLSGSSLAKIRQAVADYMQSEGCSCCRDIDAHKEHADALGKLLGVEKFSDGSGYDFGKYWRKK